jgi:CRP/FNR family cyclic AMP-dependent transcriptional regulator
MLKATAKKTKPTPLKKPTFDLQVFLDTAGVARQIVTFRRSEKIYSQGAPARGVKYTQEGGVKLSVINEGGKEAVVAILGPGDFFG